MATTLVVGDIAIGPDGKPSVHVHAVLGRRDGTAMAGHLQEARVRPTLEIIVTGARITAIGPSVGFRLSSLTQASTATLMIHGHTVNGTAR